MSLVLSDPLSPPSRSLQIRPWPDTVIDTVGHDPRSAYVEQFWLGVLGPSCIWLLRRLAVGLEAEPAGFALDLPETAGALGLSNKGGRHSPFARTVLRCCQFRMAHLDEGDGVLSVRRKLPPLNRHQLARLPESLQSEHTAWQQAQLGHGAEAERTRARHLALSLLELGEDLETTERQLGRWRYHPSVSREAAAWAWDRHQRAHAAAKQISAPDPEPA